MQIEGANFNLYDCRTIPRDAASTACVDVRPLPRKSSGCRYCRRSR
jgi:hypothetical protein